MKLLVLSEMFPCLRHPASAIFFANLLKELAAFTGRIVVVTPRAYIPAALRQLKQSWSAWYLDPEVTELSVEYGVRIIRPHVPMLPGERYLGLNSLLLEAALHPLFTRLAAEEEFDLVLGYNLIPEGIAAAGLAASLKLPSAVWAIGSDVNDFDRYNALSKRLSRGCIKKSTVVLTESRALEQRVRSLSDTAADVRTFYKGIDLRNFRDLPTQQAARSTLKLSPDRRLILFAGRLIREKGVYELAEAFADIAGRYPDLDLILAGEETEKDGLELMLQQQGLRERVTFTGIITHAEIARYMAAADLLVLPTWAEGLPNVVMEAMAAGLPVVATNVGGIPEILIDGVTGLAVPPRQPARLAEAMLRLLTDRPLRELCRSNGRTLMLKQFDVRKNAARLAGILEETRARYLAGAGREALSHRGLA